MATDYTDQLGSQVNAEINMDVEHVKDISDVMVNNSAVHS